MLTPVAFSEHTRQRLTRRLVCLIGLIILSIAALLAAAIAKLRNDAIAKARLEASYISAALDDDVEGGLAAISCASGFVKQRIEGGGIGDILSRLQQQISRSAPSLVAISIIGPDGRPRETSAHDGLEPRDYSRDEFYLRERDTASEDLKIGSPIKIANHVIIPATRRLETESGGFAGVVLFSLDPGIGATTYQRVHLGATGSIKIVGTDGTIFAGYSLPRGFDPSLIGTKVAEKAKIHWHLSTSGTFESTGQSDGIERIYYWRRIAGFPLIAIVGLGKAEALAGANREAALIAGLGSLSAALLVLMTVLVTREFSRRARQAAALDGHRRKLREANSELATAKKQADKANKSKSLFLANISHELRTPLNAILGFAEIIRDQMFGNDPARYSRYAADIYEAGTHLLSIVGGLLDLSKIEAGKLELSEGMVNLDEILKDSCRVVSAQAEAGGVTLIEKTPRLEASVYADRTALKQIVINLLANAVKFTKTGGCVSISSRLAEDGNLVLDVKDTGIGMTETEICEALEPYRQVRNGFSAHSEGTGLGLPLAARLAELHGGTLTIRSTPGSGTVASVVLPAWRVSLSEKACPQGSLPARRQA